MNPEFWNERYSESGVITTFGHLSSALRSQVYAAAMCGLRPGGVFALEA